MEGLVVKSTGSWYQILATEGTRYECRLRGNFRLHGNKQTNPLAVGDRVTFHLEEDGTGTISAVADRKNCILRKSIKLSKQTHVIAANIDRMCVVATLSFPRTTTGFIDRLLVAAEAYRIPACIVFNKTDLYDDDLRREQARLRSIYESAGYEVYEVSAKTGDGIIGANFFSLPNKLYNGSDADVFARPILLFVGHSGVGKSALMNAIDPNLQLRVGKISDYNEKGRHTTTYAELHPFGNGFLVDTPGIKEFGMVDYSVEEVSHFFPEMRRALPDCYFANCTHYHEPHCAVKEALKTGSISEERYTNYLNIIESLKKNQ
ncbi:MAG: ribosome small subunit-dependent GTPase A [Bacteroidales bacterium]|nr:ribosome small subunit-dependent GTPase A [Bacteroidales bacterium]